ncbi:MAG: 6-phosphofructokinase [Myxococcales bacterium]|nr:6-phosphofructokinase [Myxococcales bacterium]
MAQGADRRIEPGRSIAVLTSGGDAPGMNAAVRAITKVAASRGIHVVGVVGGYTGLRDGALRALTHDVSTPSGPAVVPDPEVDAAGSLGGTVLGSAREPRFLTPEGRRPAVALLSEPGRFAGLIVIGGNGSLAGAHALAQECAVPVVGMPASIDNDVGCSSSAIGVDTALNTIVDACDKICDTARAHRRAFVVEVMGRDCGYLAMAGAIAVGADAVLFREQGRGEEAIVDAAVRAIRGAFEQGRGKQRVLILKAEGVSVPCTRLVRLVEDRLGAELPGVDVRATVLGHLVRGGNPSFQDRMIAGRLGLAAVAAVLDGATDVMLGWQGPAGGVATGDPAVSRYPLDEVLRQSAALVDGTSAVTRRRVLMMEQVEGVLGL